MALSHCIRWLFRALGDPAFIQLAVAGASLGAVTPAHLEAVFFSLEVDSEHPALKRAEAWRAIVAQGGDRATSAAEFMSAVLQALNALKPEEVLERARFWASPLLFPPASTRTRPSARKEILDAGYTETHAHLRGAVPFEALWTAWMSSARARTSLRRERVTVGRWRRTWAELAEQASRHWLTFGPRNAAVHVRIRAAVDAVTYYADPRACLVLAVFVGLRRAMLHQRGRVGLGPFVESYDRFSKIQKVSAGASRQMRSLVSSLCQRFHDEGAVGLELRPTLERTATDLLQKMRELVLGYLDYLSLCIKHPETRPPLIMGLVPSIFKQQGVYGRKQLRWHDWKWQQREWGRQVKLLLELVRRDRGVGAFIVGLDAAGQERGCPPRVLAPAFQAARDFNRAMGAVPSRKGKGIPLKTLQQLFPMKANAGRQHTPEYVLTKLARLPTGGGWLGITCHAGEDFVDPLTGLRHIVDAIEGLALGPGDRLGHALAAALDPDAFRSLLAHRAGAPSRVGSEPRAEVESLGSGVWRLFKPLSEHLMDLQFVLRWGPPAWHPQTKAELLAALGHLGPGVLGSGGLSDPPLYTLPVPGLALPFSRYVDPGKVPPEARLWVTVDSQSLERFEALRQLVLDELERKKIVVESCPSSNIAVANLETPPLLTFLRENRVRVVLATDDPGLFECFPVDEVQFMEKSGAERAHLQKALLETSQVAFIWKA